jgi:DNA-binding transcriptional LysR family regulator
MFVTEFDKSRRLLRITLAGHTTAEEARSCMESVRSLLADIQPGFRLLADLSGILSMPTTAAPYIGQLMDSCAEKGVVLVVRLLPAEPSKDIGFAIMSQFHYAPDVRIVTCATMEEAANYLLE